MSSRGLNAGWLVGAVLVSSWAISSASDQRRPTAPGPRPAASALPPVSSALAADIARLENWMTAAPPIEGRRNPFKFEVRGSKFEVRDKFEVPAPVSTSNVEPVTSNIEVRTPNLSAVATVSGALTAVISFDESLHYVKRGDVIAARYRVDSVTADAVEVFDLVVGTILRLTLRSMT